MSDDRSVFGNVVVTIRYDFSEITDIVLYQDGDAIILSPMQLDDLITRVKYLCRGKHLNLVW